MEKLESLFFWKTYAWSNHQCGRRWTTLINGKDIAYTFDKYFCSIAQDLSTPDRTLVFNNFPKINKDPGEIALKKFKDHPDINLITSTIKQTNNNTFFSLNFFKRFFNENFGRRLKKITKLIKRITDLL